MNKKQKMKTALDTLFTSPPVIPESTPPEAPLSGSDIDVIEQLSQTVDRITPPPPASVKEIGNPDRPEPAGVIVQPAQRIEDKPAVPSEIPLPAVPAGGEQARAGKKSADTPTKMASGIERQLVVFQLNEEYFGLGIEEVESIIKMQPITIVPHTPVFIKGVTNLRGTVLPVIDLRTRFNLPPAETTKHTRIIVLKSHGASVGVIVDSVAEVVRFQGHQLEPAPSIAMSLDSNYIQGIARTDEQLIILLNLEKVLRLTR